LKIGSNLLSQLHFSFADSCHIEKIVHAQRHLSHRPDITGNHGGKAGVRFSNLSGSARSRVDRPMFFNNVETEPFRFAINRKQQKKHMNKKMKIVVIGGSGLIGKRW
jgi:hypothetical protein